MHIVRILPGNIVLITDWHKDFHSSCVILYVIYGQLLYIYIFIRDLQVLLILYCIVLICMQEHVHLKIAEVWDE